MPFPRDITRRSFLSTGLKSLAAASIASSGLFLPTAIGAQNPRSDWPIGEPIVTTDPTTGEDLYVDKDFFHDWRKSIPATPVDENDPNTFSFARVCYGPTDRFTNTWDPGAAGDENMAGYLRQNTQIRVSNKRWLERLVSIDDATKIYTLPFLFITGRWENRLSEREVAVFAEFFKRGGFLYADDCTSPPPRDLFSQAFEREINKALPGCTMQPMKGTHEIYHCFYDFPEGKSPFCQGNPDRPDKGLFYKDRLVCFLTSGDVHCGWWGGPPDTYFRTAHEPCLKMGTNVVIYALSH